MWHHTASSGGDGENDANYCTFGDEDAPLTNLVIGNTGIVWVCAGGATNTNGKGYAFNVSKGQIPNDSANSYAVGIEISNNGVGGSYPQSQIDACFTASVTLCNRLGLAPDDVQSHNGYAPDRKVDPATATAVEGPWQPDSCTGSGSWDVGDLKAECRRRAEQGTAEGEDMPLTDDEIERIAAKAAEKVWTYMIDTTTGDGTGDQQAARWLLDRTYNTVERIDSQS
jgi:hypothetical protein